MKNMKISTSKMSTRQVRYTNGYRYVFIPEWPSAYKSGKWKGYLSEHKYVIERSLGRILTKEELVHHLDGNKLNNRLSNLIVVSRGDHEKIHSWMDTGAFIHESYERNGMNSGKSRVIEPSSCTICGLTLQLKQKKFCSNECYIKYLENTSRNKRPTADQLKDDIENLSWLAIGRKYHVSDNAVRKWARKYGITTTTLSQALGTPKEGAETTGEIEIS